VPPRLLNWELTTSSDVAGMGDGGREMRDGSVMAAPAVPALKSATSSPARSRQSGCGHVQGVAHQQDAIASGQIGPAGIYLADLSVSVSMRYRLPVPEWTTSR